MKTEEHIEAMKWISNKTRQIVNGQILETHFAILRQFLEVCILR